MSASHYDGPWVISALIADRAERWPDRTAVLADDGDLTNADVVDRAARIASGLKRLGVNSGDRVATMLPSSAGYLSMWHGIVWAGAVDVPVNTELKGTFLRHVLRDSGARVLVTEARWVERLQGIDVPDLECLVVLGPLESEAPVPVTTIDELLDDDPAPMSPRQEPDLAHILYTSGTTGPSKGVMCSHRSYGWLLQGYIKRLGLGFDDVGYSMFPLFHQMGRAAMVGTCACSCGVSRHGPMMRTIRCGSRSARPHPRSSDPDPARAEVQTARRGDHRGRIRSRAARGPRGHSS